MSEQLGSFLPSEEDKLESYAPVRPEELSPLNVKEESEYKRLTGSEKAREKNINIYGPALDDVEILLFQLGKDVESFKDKTTEEIEEIQNTKVNLKYIRQALKREKINLKKVIMDANEKEERKKQIESVLVSTQGQKLAGQLIKADNLEYLQQILSARFYKMLAEQRRYEELSSRKISMHKGI